jgi:hypothetical protein
VVLRYGGQLLIKQILKGKMVSEDSDWPALEVGSPVPDGLHEADQLTFVCLEFGVLRRHGAAEEGDGPGALVEDGADAGARGVALDDEGGVECW